MWGRAKLRGRANLSTRGKIGRRLAPEWWRGAVESAQVYHFFWKSTFGTGSSHSSDGRVRIIGIGGVPRAGSGTDALPGWAYAKEDGNEDVKEDIGEDGNGMVEGGWLGSGGGREEGEDCGDGGGEEGAGEGSKSAGGPAGSRGGCDERGAAPHGGGSAAGAPGTGFHARSRGSCNTGCAPPLSEEAFFSAHEPPPFASPLGAIILRKTGVFLIFF